MMTSGFSIFFCQGVDCNCLDDIGMDVLLLDQVDKLSLLNSEYC